MMGKPLSSDAGTNETIIKVSSDFRTGFGTDVHRFAKDRKLVLGGVTVPYDYGLSGHSDADVLTHAVMDALLSAAGLPDIGVHFPDTDNAFKGADSLALLRKVKGLIEKAGFLTKNISAVISAERPKLSSYIPAMREKLARVLCIPKESVGITATTWEGLGFVGEKQGIMAQCSALISGV